MADGDQIAHGVPAAAARVYDRADSPEDIAAVLRQLADEVRGNETRPSAIDIADRLQHAANRVANLQNEFDRAVRDAVTRASAPSGQLSGFGLGQPITGTHPRLTGGADWLSGTPPVEGVDDFGLPPQTTTVGNAENAALPTANDAVPSAPGNEL